MSGAQLRVPAVLSHVQIIAPVGATQLRDVAATNDACVRPVPLIQTSRSEGGHYLTARYRASQGLLFTEFGYLNRGDLADGRGMRRVHTERERASWFTAALRRALKYRAKWMVLYHATELPPDIYDPPDPCRDEYGLFRVDGAVGGQRSYGKGRKPGFANPQRRRAFCDGIYNFALEKRYPTGDAGC